MSTVYYGSVVNPASRTAYDALPRCLLAVGANGRIDWMENDVESSLVQEILGQHGCIDVDVVELNSGQFIIPGFIDTHIHAPQVPNIGSGQQYELLDWLTNVTFPMEARFSDVDFAEKTYNSVVKRIINSGTTTCCYYGTLHLEATKKLADAVHTHGQRAFVGKCNMDRNCPDNYIEPSAVDSLDATKDLIAYIRSLEPDTKDGEPLVQPILTPRFAISCSDSLLSSLGTLAAADPSLRIQTHIAENRSEIAFTKELFPQCESYTRVYDSFGLLNSNTVLAHAVHLDEGEKRLIRKRNSGISHCPTSNFNLSSGIAPIGEYLDMGIKVGLGTDVSGGFSNSILNSIQTASIAAKVLAMQSTSTEESTTFRNRQLSIPTLLYLATMGGAEVCNLAQEVGSFAQGKCFDALLVDVRNSAGNPGLWWSEELSLDSILERFLFCGDDRNISKVFVKGRCVGGTT